MERENHQALRRRRQHPGQLVEMQTCPPGAPPALQMQEVEAGEKNQCPDWPSNCPPCLHPHHHD